MFIVFLLFVSITSLTLQPQYKIYKIRKMKTVIKALEIVQLQIFRCLNICTNFQTIPCNNKKNSIRGTKLRLQTDGQTDVSNLPSEHHDKVSLE